MTKTILVPVDLSKVTPDVIAEGASLAEAMNGRLMLLHVVTPSVLATAYYISPEDVAEQLRQVVSRAKTTLEKQAEPLRKQGVEVETKVREGSAVDSILQAADELDARFIVIGSHGHGAVYDLLVGSTARGLLRQTKRPVILVPYATHPVPAVAQT